MASAIKKVHMITQIVRLKQVVQRWKTKSLTHRRSVGSYTYTSSSDSDKPAARPKRRIPPGSLAVYVGSERIRFVIPTRFLKLPVFVALLRQAEEEFGFQSSGGLALPCEPGFFEGIVRLLKENEERFRDLGLEEFLKMVFEPSFCKESSGCLSFTPSASQGSGRIMIHL